MARQPTAIDRHPVWAILGAIVAAMVIAGIVLAFIWDWNWFRPMVEKKIAAELQRSVTLAHFDVQHALSAQPELVLDGITIGNPPSFPAGTETGTIQRLTLRFDLPALLGSFGKRIIVSQVVLDHPQGDLRPGPNGNPNWNFPVATASASPSSPPPRIGSLVITDGDFRFADPRLQADLQVSVRTRQPGEGHENQVVIEAHGTYAGQPFTGKFVGGAVLELRNNTKPYPVELTAQSGDTHIQLKGTIEDIEQLAGANLQLEIQGQDLADLYKIVHIPFQPSPPFTLRGHLDYGSGGKRIRFTDFAGRVGQSDLEGNFDVDRSGARPLVTADLQSRDVRLADLGGFIGAPPGAANAPTEGPKQRAEHAAQAAKPNLLPDTPIDLGKIRSTDFRVHYRGEHMMTSWAPLDRIDANLSIINGDIKLQPLDFAVGTGTIHTNIELDGRTDPITAKADIDFRQVDFQRIMQSTKMFNGIGVIGGRWEIDGRGNSLAQILAHSDGNLKLFMGSGDLSALIVNLAGLDIGGSIASLLGLPPVAQINCMISDFALQNGILDTKAMVLDTDIANIVGKGTVDLQNETLNLQILQQPKHFSIGSLRAPIDITGPFKHPDIKPDPAALGIRAGIAAALGAAFPPAALLATINLGLGKNHNCGALIAAAQAGEAPHQLPPSAPHVAGTPAPHAPPQQATAPNP